jgi:signal recognition particle receptor subunit beta
MPIVNYAARTVSFKIVYYGPAIAGKTANLRWIHQTLPGTNRGDMVSLAAGDDRTLFFDFLPVSAVTVRGFTARFQLYTVPGQVYYNMTRKLVLRGADALVFVADSQWDRLPENVESYRNLAENLREYGTSLDEIPWAIQYNKRDMPRVAPVPYLEYVMNRRPRRVPAFESVATDGRGVLASLNAVCRLALRKEFGTARAAAESAPARDPQHA